MPTLDTVQVLINLLDKLDGPTVVEVTFSRTSGAAEHHLIHDRDELAKIVEEAPPSARIRLVSVYDMDFGEPFYKMPGPGSY